MDTYRECAVCQEPTYISRLDGGLCQCCRDDADELAVPESESLRSPIQPTIIARLK